MTSFLLLTVCALFSSASAKNLRPRQAEGLEGIGHERTTAVVHIGPMKTGTTSIDMAAFRLQAELEEDGYRLPPFMNRGVDPATFVGCFVKEDKKHYYSVDFNCNESALQEAKEIATVHNSNVLMSSEFFSNPDIDVGELKKYLDAWDDVQIVAYYRRYYDFVVSFHNQFYKHIEPEKFVSVGDYITGLYKGTSHPEHYYISYSLDKYKEFYSNFRLVHMNNMPNNDGVEAFYCEAMPDAPHSCESSKVLERRKLEVHNPSVPLVYRELAYFAHQMQLFKESDAVDLETVVKLVKERQENILGLTSNDFKFKTCPTPEVLDWFLAQSLAVENELFPDYYKERGEADIKEDFAKYGSTKFCGVDAKAVIENDEGWRQFFQSL